jgi:hypothetical protein
MRWTNRTVAATVPAEPGTVMLMKLDRVLQRDHGPQGQRGGHGPAQSDGLRQEGELGEDEPDRDPRRLGPPDVMADRREPDAGQLRDQQVGGEGERGRDEEVAEADAAQLGELDRLAAGGARGLGAQLLEGDLVRAGQVAEMGRQRSPLQVGQCPVHGVDAGPRHRRLQRARRSDGDGAGDEQLGHVDVHRGPRCSERRRREPDQDRSSVLDHDVAGVEAAVGDSGGVQGGDLAPQSRQELVRHRFGRQVLERVDRDLPGDDAGQAPGAQGGQEHLGDPDAGLGRHQRREGFVLDLLKAADRCAARRVAIGEQTPSPGQLLGVLGVTAQHSDVHRSAVRVLTDVRRGPAFLPRRRS